MPDDTIFVHLTARPEIIEARMEAKPHEYTVIKKEDIPMLLERFEQQVRRPWIHHKFLIDTSESDTEAVAGDLFGTFDSTSEHAGLLTRFAEKGFSKLA